MQKKAQLGVLWERFGTLSETTSIPSNPQGFPHLTFWMGYLVDEGNGKFQNP